MKDEIVNKMERLREEVKKLRNTAEEYTEEEFVKDSMVQDATERRLQVSIEIAIDISSIIISSKDFGTPETYKDHFLILKDNEVLDKEFVEDFKNIASFRNILVHQYEEIDSESLYKYINNNLEDFSHFTQQIARYLKEENQS